MGKYYIDLRGFADTDTRSKSDYMRQRVEEELRRQHRGNGVTARAIEKTLNVSRRTVNRYLTELSNVQRAIYRDGRWHPI